MERARFVELAGDALEHIESRLGELEHEALDVDLAGDVLTLAFRDGTKYIINAHSAAGQIWMAADRSAWHFDYHPDQRQWIASKTNEELMHTVARVVGERLGLALEL